MMEQWDLNCSSHVAILRPSLEPKKVGARGARRLSGAGVSKTWVCALEEAGSEAAGTTGSALGAGVGACRLTKVATDVWIPSMRVLRGNLLLKGDVIGLRGGAPTGG